jgi:cytochrome P450
MIFASANRDPREFDVADHLILTRDGSRNLAFGEGVHFCLGMPLARLEARAGIAELLATVPEFDPAGPPRRYPSHVIRGYESIPVTVSA